MRLLPIIPLLTFLTIGPTEAASTICQNGRCFTCDGSVACNNGRCTCNGVAVPKSKFFPQPKPDRKNPNK